MDRKELGKMGEEWASCWLREGFGMEEMARNWRYQRGELDLVMKDEETAVFVEVKVVQVATPVPGYYRVNRRQRVSLRRTALAWLRQSSWRAAAWRLDMVVVYHDKGTVVDWEYFPGIGLFGKYAGLG
ncbi:MAG: YraN family protein [Verrucomicrobia bacterium]|nr:YraN family protein [Verrucomicrobiota bacterium]